MSDDNKLKEEFLKNGKKNTAEMQEMMEKAGNLDAFLAENQGEMLEKNNPVGVYVRELMYKYDKKAAKVSVDIGVHPAYIGLIMNGNRNNPSRDILISICIEIGATAAELECLLKYAGYLPLYPRNRRDAIILFCINNGKSLERTDEELISRGFDPLCKDK